MSASAWDAPNVDNWPESFSGKVAYEDHVLHLDDLQIKAEDIISVIERGNDASLFGNTIFSLTPSTSSSPQLPIKLLTTNTKPNTLPAPFLAEIPVQGLPEYLQFEQDVENTLYILISTLAGTGLAKEFYDQVLGGLLSHQKGWHAARLNIVYTSSAESVKEFAAGELRSNAEKGVKQTVLLLSGDGGIVDLINALSQDKHGRNAEMYTKPILIQIPLGTGNALFHSLHRSSTIPSLYVQSLRTLFNGTPKPLPTFRASFSPGARLLTNESQTATPLHNNTLYGAVVISYGLHATLVADSDTPAYRKYGAARFGLVANDLLFPKEGEPHAYKARVTLNGHEMERREHGYLLATLVSNLEKQFIVSPDSKPLDGKLRVVSFGQMGGEEAMGVMKAAYDGGKHVEMEKVGYEVVEEMRIGFEEEGEGWQWRRVCVDGLIVGVEEGGWVSVEMMKENEEAVMIVVDEK